MRPPVHHVVQGMPRESSRTRSYFFVHTRSRSRSTARQKPSRSVCDQPRKLPYSLWPCAAANALRRLRFRYGAVGVQAGTSTRYRRAHSFARSSAILTDMTKRDDELQRDVKRMLRRVGMRPRPMKTRLSWIGSMDGPSDFSENRE